MIRNARNRLDSLPLRRLLRMLRVTEQAAGIDSDGAQLLRRAVARARNQMKRRKRK